MCPPPANPETDAWFAKDVRIHESTLRGYLNGIAPASDTDDLVQETYIRLLRVRERTEVRSSRGLLFAIARNAVRDLFRQRSRSKTIAVAEIEALDVLDGAPGTPEVVSRRQEGELLAAAIRALPERCRAVLILRRFEHLSQKEIAARLGIAEHTVEAQLTKAMHRCMKFFEKSGALPPDRP